MDNANYYKNLAEQLEQVANELTFQLVEGMKKAIRSKNPEKIQQAIDIQLARGGEPDMGPLTEPQSKGHNAIQLAYELSLMGNNAYGEPGNYRGIVKNLQRRKAKIDVQQARSNAKK